MFREVSIRAVLNGFIVTVGCQTLVFDNKEELLNGLSNYIDNPTKTEERFIKNSRYGMIGGGPLAGIGATTGYVTTVGNFSNQVNACPEAMTYTTATPIAPPNY